MRSPIIKFAAALIAAAGIFIFAGCGSSSGSDSESFAGKISGSDAFIYLVRDGDEVNGYLCDGHDGQANNTAWVTGIVVSENSVAATNSESGVVVTADLSGGNASGEVTLTDGSVLAFDIPAVDGDSGLYRGTTSVDGLDIEGGWILLPNGEQRGAIRAKGTQTQLVNANIASIRTALEPATKAETVHLFLISTATISTVTTSVSITPQVTLPVSQVRGAFL